jgi:flagellar biosynthesis/type III secretory pathway chaperone
MDAYAKLLSVMDQLNGQHRELLALEQKKIRLVVDQDWKQLDAFVVKSNTLLTGIDQAERRRIEIIEAIDKTWTDNPPSLSELAEHAPLEYRASILRAGEMLREIMLELKALNKQCEQLIAGSLEVVDFTLSLLSGAGARGRTYSGDGEERAEGRDHPSLVFDVKA